MIFINHISLPSFHYTSALSSASSLSMSVTTPTAADLDLPPMSPAPTRCAKVLLMGQPPCWRRCASLRLCAGPPRHLSITEISDGQTDFLIAFPKLKGTKIGEVHIPKWPSSSLRSADPASRAAGADCAFQKERDKYRAQPFIKLVPFIY